MKKSVFLLFLLGAVIGTALDSLHIHVSIAFYTHPVFWKTTWWVPPLFGLATVFIAVSHFKMHPHLQHRRKILAGSFLSFLVAYFLIAYWEGTNLEKSVSVFLLYAAVWGLLDRSFLNLLLAMGTAIIGSSVESTLGYFDLYHYTQPDIYGIPFWLPALYLHASAAGGYLGRCLLVPGAKVEDNS